MIARTLLLTLPSLFLLSLGWSTEVNDVLTKIEQAEKNISSLTFNFDQNIKFLDTDIESETGGKASFVRPNKLRITKRRPKKQITISNGKKVWVYTPSYNQVWEGKWRNWQKLSQFIPKGILPVQGYVSYLKKDFNVSLKKSGKADRVQLKAMPKNSGVGYNMVIDVSTETWLPLKTVYVSETAIVVTHFSGFDVNPQLKDSVFSFRPPPGTDIIPFNE